MLGPSATRRMPLLSRPTFADLHLGARRAVHA
jgi:hypothetical protein